MEKTKLSTLINSLTDTAIKEGWVPRYDRDLDYFYWTKENISDDAKLIKVSHETSLYYNPAGKIEGVFVEYMSANFVEHNPLYEKFVNSFTKEDAEGIFTMGDDKEGEKYLIGFGEAIRADIYYDAETLGGGELNLDELASAAFK